MEVKILAATSASRFRKRRSLLLGFALLLIITGASARARAVRLWPDEELFAKADLVVLAMPIITGDTKEHLELPGLKASQ